MNEKKTKYYNGPDGVFYNPIFEEIFILERRWDIKIINTKTGNVLCSFYDYSSPREIIRRTAMLISPPIIRLGDL